MKNKDLYKYRDSLSLCDFTHPRITFIVNKNKRALDKQIEEMELEIKPSDEFNDFAKKREELVREYAKKDDHGKPIIKTLGNGQQVYDVPDKDDKDSDFNKALDKLEEENKALIDIQAEKERKYFSEFLEDESDFKPNFITLQMLEDNDQTCTQEVMDGIYWMIQE